MQIFSFPDYLEVKLMQPNVNFAELQSAAHAAEWAARMRQEYYRMFKPQAAAAAVLRELGRQLAATALALRQGLATPDSIEALAVAMQREAALLATAFCFDAKVEGTGQS
jgi:hypothetical protein